MGLGTKIKEALRGDDHEHGHDNTSASQSQMPGTFQDDELPQRHGDGKPYTAPHGSMVGDEGHTGRAGTTAEYLATSGGRHHENKLHKDIDEYHPFRDGHNTSSTGKTTHRPVDPGVGLTSSASARDPTTQKDSAYWGDMPHGTHEAKTMDMPDRSNGHHQHHHDGHLPDQAVGGGVYNSVTGAGSPEHTGTRTTTGHSTGITSDSFTSGSKGAPLSSSGGNPSTAGNNNMYDGQTGLRGDDGSPTSRLGHTEEGLAGVGAATAGTAGYAAHEHSGHRDGRDSTGHTGGDVGYTGGQQRAPVPGMLHSSMLEPDQGFGGATAHHGSTGGGTGLAAAAAPSSASGTGSAMPSHFGPGHEGSKVLHTCEHCGRDNDISKYFSKDVVYRLGQ